MQWWRAALAALALCGAAGAGAGAGTGGPGGPLAELLARAAARRPGERPPRRPLVPEAMRALYTQLSASDPLLPEVFLAGRTPLHKRTANTVRGFTHEGDYYHHVYVISISISSISSV